MTEDWVAATKLPSQIAVRASICKVHEYDVFNGGSVYTVCPR